MTEPIPRVNWQCPKCLRKWSVPAGRKAPALCRECAKLPASTAVRPNTQSGTPTTSGKRGIAPETTAPNEPQYRPWACPQCQKQWRVVQTRSKPAFCRDCGYRESASQVGAEVNVHRQGSDRRSRDTRVPDRADVGVATVERGQLLLALVYAMAASSFKKYVQVPHFFPQPVTPDRWEKVFVAACLFNIGMLSLTEPDDVPVVPLAQSLTRMAQSVAESLSRAIIAKDPSMTSLIEDLVAFVNLCDTPDSPCDASDGSELIDSLRLWIGLRMLGRMPEGERDVLLCCVVEQLTREGSVSALAAL
jgi:hypothetical protein